MNFPCVYTAELNIEEVKWSHYWEKNYTRYVQFNSRRKEQCKILTCKVHYFQFCYYSSGKSGISSVSSANLNDLSTSIFKPSYYMPQFTPIVYNQLKLILQYKQNHRQATFWIKHTTWNEFILSASLRWLAKRNLNALNNSVTEIPSPILVF